MVGHKEAIGVSVIIPVLNEAENLAELHRRLTAALTALGRTFEVVFVDDGSGDTTPAILRELAQKDARVRGVRLDRNYGQHAALMAGMRHARGAVVVTMDADMQTPPEDIPVLLAKLEEGFEVVFGVFERRQHPPLQRLTSAIGHMLVEYALRLPRSVHFSPFRALDRQLINRMTAFTGTPVQLETLMCRCTNRMGAVTVRHEPRRAGETKYTLRRRLRFALNLARGIRQTAASRAACANQRPQYVVAECFGDFGDAPSGAAAAVLKAAAAR